MMDNERLFWLALVLGAALSMWVFGHVSAENDAEDRRVVVLTKEDKPCSITCVVVCP